MNATRSVNPLYKCCCTVQFSFSIMLSSVVLIHDGYNSSNALKVKVFIIHQATIERINKDHVNTKCNVVYLEKIPLCEKMK